MFKTYLIISVVIMASMIATIKNLNDRIKILNAEHIEIDNDMTVLIIERHIIASNHHLPLSVSQRIAVAGLECAHTYNLDPLLLFATMQQESNFNPRAIGASGERGLMQISQPTAKDIGLPWKHAFDVLANTCAGASYLAHHVHERGVHDGLLRYNGGGEPSYPLLVMDHYQTYTSIQ